LVGVSWHIFAFLKTKYEPNQASSLPIVLVEFGSGKRGFQVVIFIKGALLGCWAVIIRR